VFRVVLSEQSITVLFLVLLEHITVFRIQITQLSLLLVCESDVMRLLPAAILCQTGKEVYDATGRAEANEAQANAVALMEEGFRIRGLEAITGDDSSYISESNLPGRSHGTTMMTAKIHGEPAHDDRHGAVCS